MSALTSLLFATRFAPLLAEFKWDPQIRGIVIVLVSVVILIGSVYLILATNVGARLGFLLTVAGLSGWMVLMGALWWVNAQGLKGRAPSWKPVEISVGPASSALFGAGDGLPGTLDGTPTDGWRLLPAGNAVLGDATAAADKILAPDTTPAHGETTKAEPKFVPPYANPTAYVQVAAYEKGGKETGIWFSIKNHHFYTNGSAWNPANWFRSQPHYVVITVQKAAAVLPGADPLTTKARPDTSATPRTLVLIRDRGSIRFPPVMVTLGSLLIFAVTCSALHRRDKELMAKKAGGRPVAAAA